ncbi:matrixin family metalloprotease [Nocardia sp. NPDC049149]|uniref:matrixin family metalloprotease n=1 Tax=Nocardia sp. NPDC049149 TaxID=3364315 RepID=UPI003716E615
MSGANRRNYRGKHRAKKSPAYGSPRLAATLIAGTLLGPAAVTLTTSATAVAAAPSFGFKVQTQGNDSQGRAILHYNNTIKDEAIEKAVKHLNSTPGINWVLKPGTGRGAIKITSERFGGGVAGMGGWDGSGPFVKLDPKNKGFNADDRTEVAAHELLHAMGLDHNDSGCSIMASSVNRCNKGPTPLSKDEINVLNSKYKKGAPGKDDPSDQNKPGDSEPGDSEPGDSNPGGDDETGQPDDSTDPGEPDDNSSNPWEGDDNSSNPWEGDDNSSNPWEGDDNSSNPGEGDDNSWDPWQSQPDNNSWDPWQNQPDNSSWDPWQSQPDNNSWDPWQNQQDDNSWQSDSDQGTWNPWQSQQGQSPWDNWW